ncbi:hypothetical protein [Methanococcoides sp. NM1]|uniref:hypothetical protein n=1 Tax=Methanococcoides sp. NM1 TaxID=1201013 RepID=UPI00143842E9|nr:hypothetical protein [Methanococcoides sp. NM1]
MNRKSIFITILMVTLISITPGCTEVTEDSTASLDETCDQITEGKMLGFDESIEQLKSEMEKDDGITEVSFLDINGEKILVVSIHEPFEADAFFEYSSEMCDRYLKGYGIENVTIDVRVGKEQLVYDTYRMDT